MLKIIEDTRDPLLDLICDDPVRPEISKEFRVGPNRFVAVLFDGQPQAMVCVNLLDHVPKSTRELGDCESFNTAVFYTIWSYVPGCAGQLLREIVKDIRIRFPTVNKFVTLSPKTDMARRFHLKNGAVILSDNEESVNYEYHII